MSDLIVLAFADEATALRMRGELAALQAEYLIETEDVVVVTRDMAGKVRLHQPRNMVASQAMGGGFWGLVIGLVFLNPVAGAAIGAGVGAAVGAVTDVGIDDDFMREVGETLIPGSAAVFVLVRRMSADEVLARLQSFRAQGRVIRTTLSDEIEARLRSLIEAPHLDAAMI